MLSYVNSKCTRKLAKKFWCQLSFSRLSIQSYLHQRLRNCLKNDILDVWGEEPTDSLWLERWYIKQKIKCSTWDAFYSIKTELLCKIWTFQLQISLIIAYNFTKPFFSACSSTLVKHLLCICSTDSYAVRCFHSKAWSNPEISFHVSTKSSLTIHYNN